MSLIRARTLTTLLYWSKFFFIYQLAFYLYFFAFPYTFSYLAFATATSFILHASLYFYNNFEIPAVENHEISSQQVRQLNGNPHLSRVFARNAVILQVPTPNIVLQAHIEQTAAPQRAVPIVVMQANRENAEGLNNNSNNNNTNNTNNNNNNSNVNAEIL